MRIRTVTTSLIGLALVLALAAPAAAQGAPASSDRPLLGAGVSFLKPTGEGSETGTGFFVDVAVPVRPMGNASIGIVGDFGFHNFEFDRSVSFAGGARFTATATDRVHPFGQATIGVYRFSLKSNTGCEEDCSASEMALTPGGGVDVHLNDKFNFRGQIDFPIIFFEGDTDTAIRFSFGISMRLGG